jgi:hypothetical protein
MGKRLGFELRTVSSLIIIGGRIVKGRKAALDRFLRLIIQGAYKLLEYFAKPYFHKYWTEIHHVTTIWKRNVCSFIVTLNAFDVRPTCDTADVQSIHRANCRTHQLRSVGDAAISFKHWFTLFPRDGGSDYRTTPNVTFTVCNRHEFHDLATLPTQVTA